ncbi:MAG: MFS transporter [Candidatus Paceibacterota bacterium]
MKTVNNRRHLYLIYAMSIFFVLHYVFPVYIISTFLSEYLSEGLVGVVYTAASILTIFGFILASRGVRRLGNFWTTLILVLIEVATLIALVIFRDFVIVIPAIIVHLILATVIGYNIDLFIEAYSIDSETGGIRGTNLTLNNMAWVVGPIIAGFLLTNSDYWKIFLAALVMLVPMLALLITRFRKFDDPPYARVRFFNSLRHVWGNPNVRNVFCANFMLQVFFAWMTIYTPLYLHEHIGLPFSEIGVIFTIMLSAYILLEYPLGKLADSTYGEVEFMTGGFLLIAVTTVLLSVFTLSSALWWAAALFATRIGASMVEVMSETYFFKKIDSSGAGDLSIFRMTRPLGYIIAPALASGFLSFFDMRYLFVFIGCMALFGIYFALQLKDTR